MKRAILYIVALAIACVVATLAITQLVPLGNLYVLEFLDESDLVWFVVKAVVLGIVVHAFALTVFDLLRVLFNVR